MALHLSLLLLLIIFYRLSAVGYVSNSMWNNRQVTGVEGGSVTVHCYYSNSGDMKWCRMSGDCVMWYSGTLNGTSVTLKRTSEANNRTVLTVTMSGLKMENTDWYWCRVGELEMPVHITVSQQTATQRTSKMSSTTQDPTPQQPSASPTAESVQTDNTSQGAEGNMEEVHQRLLSLLQLSVKVLGMLVVVTAGILVTWKMWRKHQDNKAKDQTTNNSVDPFPEADDDVTYSTVIFQHKAQLKGQTKDKKNRQETRHPEAAFLVAGDFSSSSLRHIMPNVHQHNSYATRGNKDQCYSSHKQAYKAFPHHPFGKSDHDSILLLPVYKQKLKGEVPMMRCIEKWSSESEAMLQDSFASAD
ncbi:CMRF35-like molecule 5 [Salvelinus sp. IW2-2015]|uniref:CMRF35-like molecule 5 n=1 Tax=Salvelinus sp. IW2-2015 TaxID=2691554 RepID=UPI0038D49073